jgi:hypothetical protein
MMHGQKNIKLFTYVTTSTVDFTSHNNKVWIKWWVKKGNLRENDIPRILMSHNGTPIPAFLVAFAS